MNPLNILVKFANAILALETATKEKNGLGTQTALDEIIQCWNVSTMKGELIIPATIAELTKLRSEPDDE